MAVTVNVNTSRSNEFYTGLAQLKIVAINPTMQEFKDVLGIQIQQEPVYLTEVDSRTQTQQNGSPKKVRQNRLEFHFETVEQPGIPAGIRARMSIFTRYEYIKGLYKNQFCAFDADQALLLDNEGAKNGVVSKLFDGEIDLLKAISALVQKKKADELTLETLPQIIFNNDVTELTSILQQAKNNTVQGLLGVQTSNGKHYQTVYRTLFQSWQTKLDYLFKNYNEKKQFFTNTDFGPVDEDFKNPNYDTIRPRRWYPAGETPAATGNTRTAGQQQQDDDTPPPPSNSNPNLRVPVGSNDDDNDLPF